MQGMEVTKNYVQVLGLRPVAGRSFADADFAPGPVKVILLGHEFWQRAFGGDRQIIGKTGPRFRYNLVGRSGGDRNWKNQSRSRAACEVGLHSDESCERTLSGSEDPTERQS